MMHKAQDVPGPVQLNEIGQVALTVRNLERAKNFYQNTLGMQFLFESGSMAFFQCGSVRLMIGTSDTAVSPQNNMILYFRVSDIHEVHAALNRAGVSIVQEPHLVARMKSHDLWISFLKDPDDNTLGLMSELARTKGENKQ